MSLNPVDSNTALGSLTHSFYSDESSWKRVATIAVPLILIGAGIAYVVKRYYFTTTTNSPIPLHTLQAALEKEIKPIEPIPYSDVIPRHEGAKKAFSDALSQFNIGSEVRYVKAERGNYVGPSTEQEFKIQEKIELDPQIFCWSRTRGVEKDILAASKKTGEIHLFGVASQYNSTEAISAFTPPPGQAMSYSEADNTQGPKSQRTNPLLFELVNGYLANGGFNMLANVLDEKSMPALYHGYLTPQDVETEESVAQNFKDRWTHVEQPCVSSHPDQGGSESVYLMMSAAPAYGHYGSPKTPLSSITIQFYAALANFTAQFNQVLHLAQSNPDKKIVYHAAAVGLGVFENNPDKVGRAFAIAADHFKNQLLSSEIPLEQVRVQFEVFGSTLPARQCVESIGLKEKSFSLLLSRFFTKFSLWPAKKSGTAKTSI